jgi:hypothetical protein
MDVDERGIHQALPTKEKGWEQTALISWQSRKKRTNKRRPSINSIPNKTSQIGPEIEGTNKGVNVQRS